MRIATFLFAAMLTVGGGRAVGAGQPQQEKGLPASVKIGLPQVVFKAGSPVSVKVDLTNTSNRKLWIYRPAVLAYQVDLHDNQGKQVLFGYTEPLQEEHGRHGIRLHTYAGSVWRTTLEPGSTLKDRLNLSAHYDLKNPGKYALQVAWHDPETKVIVKSNKITLTITP